ncbi:metallophosphoesterase family protein [Paenibacillus hodogayensis]|uniref:Metallophosphoesterase family protein n=1 Tax=Paenibacillus hodogayensis TaxID=279208 RepID=A0ABV5W312_9BACL
MLTNLNNSTAFFTDDKLTHTGKIPLTGELRAETKADFAFAIVGDRTGIAVPGVFESAMQAVKSLQPDFVVSVGDLVEGYCSDAEEAHEEWDEIDSLIGALSLPFFQTIGNHDYSGNKFMRDVWRERKGSEYYAFRRHDCLFLVVNTEPSKEGEPGEFEFWRRYIRSIRREQERFQELTTQFLEAYHRNLEAAGEHPYRETAGFPTIDDGQIEFFREVLSHNQDVRWTFVFMHQPGWKTNVRQYERLMGMLQGRSYTVAAGHLHYVELSEEDGNPHIQVGSAGAYNSHAESIYGGKPSVKDGNFSGKGTPPCILWVSMKDGTPSVSVIPLHAFASVEGYKRSAD